MSWAKQAAEALANEDLLDDEEDEKARRRRLIGALVGLAGVAGLGALAYQNRDAIAGAGQQVRDSYKDWSAKTAPSEGDGSAKDWLTRGGLAAAFGLGPSKTIRGSLSRVMDSRDVGLKGFRDRLQDMGKPVEPHQTTSKLGPKTSPGADVLRHYFDQHKDRPDVRTNLLKLVESTLDPENRLAKVKGPDGQMITPDSHMRTLLNATPGSKWDKLKFWESDDARDLKRLPKAFESAAERLESGKATKTDTAAVKGILGAVHGAKGLGTRGVQLGQQMRDLASPISQYNKAKGDNMTIRRTAARAAIPLLGEAAVRVGRDAWAGWKGE